MKNACVFLFIIILLFNTAFASTDIDLSGMSLNELIELKNKINLAMFETDGWEEVIVPEGVYVIGEDIPEGKWTVHAAPKHEAGLVHGSCLDNNGRVRNSNEHSFFKMVTDEEYKKYDKYYDFESVNVDLVDGFFLEVFGSSVIFTPYEGKTDLGFKKK